jgi:hypothetical protein
MEQALCHIKVFYGYSSTNLVQLLSPFPQEESPFMAVSLIEFCYRNHQLGLLHA